MTTMDIVLGVLGLGLLGMLSQRAGGRRVSTPPDKAALFEAAPVINSHRIRCPDCGSWATLMVNAAGRQRRVCDQCGTDDL